jgi:hypothetical protein
MAQMKTLALVAFLGLAMLQSAMALDRMSCAQAMTLVVNHPDIEATSIITMVVSQWQAMDRHTRAGGHAAIAAQMMASPVAINALSAQCNANPGQMLGAAAAQVYRQARAQLDGF